MAIKVFLDVNIFLDFFLKRKGFSQAENILKIAAENEIDAYTSSAVLQTVSFYLHKDRGSNLTKTLLLELLSFLKLIEADKTTVEKGLMSNFKDIEDAIHYFSALKAKMNYIITSDIKFQKSGMPILPILGAEKFIAEIL